MVKAGRLDESIELFNQIIDIDPNNAEARLNIGTAYGYKGQWNKALEIFKQAIELDPNSGRGHFLLATAYGSTKRYDLAWKHIRIAEKVGCPAHLININIRELRKFSKEP